MINKIDLKLFLNKIKEKKSVCIDDKVLNSTINYYPINLLTIKQNYFFKKTDCPVSYIIIIKYTKTNTLLSVTDANGVLKYYSSAGQSSQLNKKKTSRITAIKFFLKSLVVDLEFLKTSPIALHLKNVDYTKIWITRLFKSKFFVKTVQIFNIIPHNGCRKRKKKKKKIRSFAKKRFKLKKRNGRVVYGGRL